MFFFGRPKPKFRPGQLVGVQMASPRRKACYMVIVYRRWVRPNGESKKQWVYDGPIFEVSDQVLRFSTGGLCFLEASLTQVSGVQWGV